MGTAAEIRLFHSDTGFVYQVPPATTSGHRAETWNVETPLAEVCVTLIRDGEDHASVRLLDPKTNELWAECPISIPLHTCVERVIDSSRYFVIRVVDSQTSKHAFIGLGYAEREVAGDFYGALIDYQHYMERKQRAESMSRGEMEGVGDQGHGSDGHGLGLSSNVTLKLNPNHSHSGGFVSNSNKHSGQLNKTFSLMFQNGGLEAAFSTASGGSPHGPGSGISGMSGMSESEEWGAFESAPDGA